MSLPLATHGESFSLIEENGRGRHEHGMRLCFQNTLVASSAHYGAAVIDSILLLAFPKIKVLLLLVCDFDVDVN